MHRKPLERRQVSPLKHRPGDGKTGPEQAACSAPNADTQVGVSTLLVLLVWLVGYVHVMELRFHRAPEQWLRVILQSRAETPSCLMRGCVPGRVTCLPQENAEMSLWRSSLAQGTADGSSYLQYALLLLAVVHHRALHTILYTDFFHRLVRTLQQNPATEDFVYLRRAKRHPADVNPYALQVNTLAWFAQSAAFHAAPPIGASRGLLSGRPTRLPDSA